MGQSKTDRLRVLVSAYACEPGKGSEPGVGWTWARAAAMTGHEVWLFTRENNRAGIEDALALEPALSLKPVYFDLPERWRRWKRGSRRVRSYYALWQLLARKHLKVLHEQHQFDVAHHLTFGLDWLPSAAIHVEGLPSIWGPIGGTTQTPWILARYLGAIGVCQEIVRTIIGGIGRRLWGRSAAKRAVFILAQNEDVAAYFRRWGRTIVEPNSAFDFEEFRSIRRSSAETFDSEKRRAIFVGRLEPWKGLMLALAALEDPRAAAWELDVYGDGIDMRRAKRRVELSGMSHRVTFHGQVPRVEVLLAIASADALIHPAFHDSSSWSVGEAVTLGVAVVCLSVGGPRTLASAGTYEEIAPSSGAAGDLASSLQHLEDQPRPQPTDRWLRERLPEKLDAWYREAVRLSG